MYSVIKSFRSFPVWAGYMAFSRLILKAMFTCVQTVTFSSFLVSVSLMDCERVLLVKLWTYENHIWELRNEELVEGRSSQLYKQLMQLRKESLKKNSDLSAIRTLDLCDAGAALYQLSQQANWEQVAWIFFKLSFRNFISCVYNSDNLPSNNSSLRSSHILFSYIHNFIIILSRVYHEPIPWPAPSWLVSLIGTAPGGRGVL